MNNKQQSFSYFRLPRYIQKRMMKQKINQYCIHCQKLSVMYDMLYKQVEKTQSACKSLRT